MTIDVTTPTPETIKNPAAAGVPYFSPAQAPPAGTAVEKDNITPIADHKAAKTPSLFTPFKLRGLEFQNRIVVSPMCQYSADIALSEPNAWHLTHLGGIIQRGPGLTMVEATAVTPNGRISPNDLGLWSDSQIPAYKTLADYTHSQNQKIAIQIAHAGRKASTVPPFLHAAHIATSEAGGWPDNVVGPIGGVEGQWDHKHAIPRATTTAEVAEIVTQFADTARRAVTAGFDVIEIHSAHGYLIHEFLSPASNTRTDKYGGSFENRIRLLIEIVDAVNAAIPKTTPLMVRISGTDWLEYKYSTPEEAAEHSWTPDQAAKLAVILQSHGVDLLDVSSGGNHHAQKVQWAVPNYQSGFAKIARDALLAEPTERKMLISTVGAITKGVQAQKLLDEGFADVIMAGRQFQRSPALVWDWADELGVNIKVANQIEWGIKGFRRR